MGLAHEGPHEGASEALLRSEEFGLPASHCPL